MGDVATEMVAGGDIDKDLILDEGRYPVIANAGYLIDLEMWNTIIPLCSDYDEFDFALAAYLSSSDFRESVTPSYILKLASRILDVKKDDEVADVCCGGGYFVTSEYIKEPEAIYSGFDYDSDMIKLSKIRSALIGLQSNIIKKDVLEFITDEEKPSFDKIFSNYELGQSLQSNKLNKTQELLFDKYPTLSKVSTFDWIFNSSVFSVLKDKGKAVAFLSASSVVNRSIILIFK